MFAFFRSEHLDGLGDGVPEIVDCWCRCLFEEGFELREGHFDRIEIRAAGRQESKLLAGALDRLSDSDRFAEMLGLDGGADGVSWADVLNCYKVGLAECPAQIRVDSLDDILGEVEPINIPGTIAEYPNWRRRLKVDCDQFDERLLPAG